MFAKEMGNYQSLAMHGTGGEMRIWYAIASSIKRFKSSVRRGGRTKETRTISVMSKRMITTTCIIPTEKKKPNKVKKREEREPHKAEERKQTDRTEMINRGCEKLVE